MSAQREEYKKRLEEVLDSFEQRSGKDVNVSEILEVAERLVTVVHDSKQQANTSFAQELATIHAHISNTKEELADIPGYDGTRIPGAGKELEAIVEATEAATNQIMGQAEIILAADPSDLDAYLETVTNAVMQIFESCSFQDITGQRISKVVSALQYVDERVSLLADTFGFIIEESDQPENEEEQRKKDLMLHGPALEGDGIDQDEIDSLFD